MHITSHFDTGNIRLVEPPSAHIASLAIVPDRGTDFLHWFHFRCVSDVGVPHRFDLVNAGQSKTPDGWKGYRAVASYDRRHWFRLPTTFESGVLSFEITPKYPIVFFAHFAPYTLDRHARLLSWCQRQPGVGIEVLSESVEGRPINLVRLGEGGTSSPVCWITAGQHPGEPMGAWFVEGLLHQLLDPDDALARTLRRNARFYIVPHANPDGSFQGRLRTNAAAVDLNRAWREPCEHRSPEILGVVSRMEQTGVDFFLDVHGDETIPYCFVVNSDSVPGISPKLIGLRERFERALEAANPDFQREHGYPPEEPGSADLDIGANWVAHRFGCLAMTLEQPFKDPGNSPITESGWSPSRSVLLGAASLTALAQILQDHAA